MTNSELNQKLREISEPKKFRNEFLIKGDVVVFPNGIYTAPQTGRYEYGYDIQGKPYFEKAKK